MTLKTSFATVLKAIRNKRNISQRDFGDNASRTYLSKLEGARSSITLDKLDQVSERLSLSPLTLMTLTLAEETGVSAADLIVQLRAELESLKRDGGLPELAVAMRSTATRGAPRTETSALPQAQQTEICF